MRVLSLDFSPIYPGKVDIGDALQRRLLTPAVHEHPPLIYVFALSRWPSRASPKARED